MSVGTTRLSFLGRLRDRTDQLSWAEFHNRYGELLYSYARRRGASHAEAEEIVQEVEISVFKAMERFRYDPRKGRFRAYLRAAVGRTVGRRAAKRVREETVQDPLVLDRVAEAEPETDAQWEREWRLHRLRWALRSIAPEFETVTLEAFRLAALANRPVKETAQCLGISEASVYQAKSRVLKRLRERIRSLDPDEDAWS